MVEPEATASGSIETDIGIIWKPRIMEGIVSKREHAPYKSGKRD
jgi:hypothetical protein